MNTALLNDMILEVQYVNVLIIITCHGSMRKSENQVMKDMLNMMRHATSTRIIRYKGHPIRDIVYPSEKLRDMTL